MQAKKARKIRDSRIVIAGFDKAEFEYDGLSAADWLNVQRAFGRAIKIPAPLRDRLSIITMVYGQFAQARPVKRSITSVSSDIDQWCRQTRALRRSIWKSKTTQPEHVHTKLSEIIDHYFRSARGSGEMFALAHFAQLLDGAEAIGRHFLDRIDRLADRDKRIDLWLIWVALIICFCRLYDLPVEHSVRKQVHPGLLSLVRKLQDSLAKAMTSHMGPNKNKSRVQSLPLKAKDSTLQTEAGRALRISEDTSLEILLLLLTNWSVGLSRFRKQNNEHDKSVSEILAAFSIIDAKIAESKR